MTSSAASWRIEEAIKINIGCAATLYLVGIARQQGVGPLSPGHGAENVRQYYPSTSKCRPTWAQRLLTPGIRAARRLSAGDEQINRFVGGKMHFVKFGNHAADPIWPVDIFLPQRRDAAAIWAIC